MKVGIIGTGMMGRGFATALASKHELIIGSRDEDRAIATASKVGAAGGATYTEAAVDADVVILTVPWEAMDETLALLGQLQGTVVVDVSFPYNKREREALEGSSTAEEIQKRLPNARVFKGWNHVHARHLTDPEVERDRRLGPDPRREGHGVRPGIWDSFPSMSVHSRRPGSSSGWWA